MSPYAPARIAVLIVGLLIPVTLTSAIAGSVSPGVPAGPTDLPPEARQGLAPWQQQIMLQLARDSSGTSATDPFPAPSQARTTTADGIWAQEPPPSARYLHTAIYDPVRRRMIVFGGYSTRNLVNDVWALSLDGAPEWTFLNPVGTLPSARHLMSAVYDPVRDRVVIFGGFDRGVGYLDDVWALSLGSTPTWNRITPTGIGPAARARHSAVYDPVRDRMLVFGGFRADAGPSNEVWALSLSEPASWTPLSPIGQAPAVRYDQSAVYDPVRDRVLVFGGYDGQGLLNDVWDLELKGRPRWQQLDPPGPLPAPRSEHAAVLDRAGNRMVVFGGYTDARVGDTWSLSLNGRNVWTRIDAPSEPSVRWGHSAIYDPDLNQMVIYGGTPDGSGLLVEVQSLFLSGSPSWTEMTPPAAPPRARYGSSAVYDSGNGRMLVFGGYDTQAGFTNELWAVSLTGKPLWTMLHPSGTPPSPRDGHSAIYDRVRNRMLVFGGQTDDFTSNELWALSLSGDPAWTQLTPAGGAPEPRALHTAIYDAAYDRMVVFGGSSSNGTWALSLNGVPAWTKLTPSGTLPQARFEHSAIYDPLRRRMLVFGGFNQLHFFNDVWALSLDGATAWDPIATSGAGPSERAGHVAIYDPVRDRMVILGGSSYSSPGSTSDPGPWSLSLGNSEWALLEPFGTPPNSAPWSAIYDPLSDRMLAYAGDLWGLRWGAPVLGSPSAGVPGPASLQASPNPSSGEVTIAFTLAQAGEAKVSIFDVTGRDVRTLFDGVLPAGPRTIRWDRRTASSALAQPGLYFCELRAGSARSLRELVLVR